MLKNLIAFDAERTFEQVPAFAMRVLVDNAAKSLSPAINDPVTAVHVVDRIEVLLNLVARGDLDIGELREMSGTVRALVPAPTWRDFLILSVTEIRQYGHDSVQVVCQLRGMLRDLTDSIPQEYLASVHEDFGKLDRTIDRRFPDAEDGLVGAAAGRQ
jgi:uncharacterized membrane protein